MEKEKTVEKCNTNKRKRGGEDGRASFLPNHAGTGQHTDNGMMRRFFLVLTMMRRLRRAKHPEEDDRQIKTAQKINWEGFYIYCR